MNKYFGQKYFGKPLPAGAIGGRERPYVQSYGQEVNISSQFDLANLAKLSSALLEQGDKAGPYGRILATGLVLLLVSACTTAPNAGPEISHAPTPTPDNPLPTHTLTPTSTHTLVPTSTLFPSRTPTFAAPEKPSQYSAADNNAADLANGIARLDETRYKARLVQSSRAIKADPNHKFLDYEAAMEFLNPQKDFWGKAKLPSRGRDFWITGNGGLGFTETDPTHFGMAEVLDATAHNLLVKGGDDLYRGRLVVQQKYFEVGLIQAVRAAAKLRWPGEDFTKFGPGSALANHDSEIKQLFFQVLADLGYESVGGIHWPGAVDLKTLDETELESIVPDGNACVAERPSAASRKDQKPEKFRKVAFRGGVESRTPGQDENRTLIDKGTDQVMLVVVKKETVWGDNIRVELLDAGASVDNLQPDRKGQTTQDSEEVKEVDAALDRLVPCGPGQAGPESSKTPTSTPPAGGPDAKISRTPPKGGTPTPPAGTPGTQPPPEKTQPPVTQITLTTPSEITRVTPAPTITSQPAISTSTPGQRPGGTPTAVPRPIDTLAPANTPVAVPPTAFPQPAASRTPSAP